MPPVATARVFRSRRVDAAALPTHARHGVRRLVSRARVNLSKRTFAHHVILRVRRSGGRVRRVGAMPRVVRAIERRRIVSVRTSRNRRAPRARDARQRRASVRRASGGRDAAADARQREAGHDAAASLRGRGG